MTRDEAIALVSNAETRAAQAAQIAEDAERRRAQAETALIAMQTRVVSAEKSLALAETVAAEMARTAAIEAYEKCEALCALYLADKPSNTDVRAGYVNASMGIQGRIQALIAAMRWPDDGKVARLMSKLRST